MPFCLAAVMAAGKKEAEVIVVDDASTDGTAEKAESLGAKVIRMEKNAGPSAARNLGAKHAQGEILFFVDSDVVIKYDAVYRVVDHLDRHPAVAAVFGSYDSDPMAKGTVSRYRNLLHHYTHQHGLAEASTFWAGCGAVRRSVFKEVGGFDEAAYPRCIEDIELGYRLKAAGHSLRLDRDLLCKHLKRWTLLGLIKTDVFCRAIPWARLNWGSDKVPDDLNIRKSQKVSVALTGLTIFFLVFSLFSPWYLFPAALLLLLIIALNGDLFIFFHENYGPNFALKCIPLHLLYFLYSGSSYLYVMLAEKLGRKIKDGNTRA